MIRERIQPSRPFAVRHAQRADVQSIVAVHREGFPGFFLTFLGPVFLRELYTATLTDPDGIGFVAVDQKTIGFVIGTMHPAGFYRRLLYRHWWRFALASVPPALRRMSIIPRLLRAFSMPNKVVQQEGRGNLMSITVLPEAQGLGVGQALVLAFLNEASTRGLRHVDLTTDRDANEAANHFYQSLGFVCERTFVTPEGRAMNEYVIDMTSLPDHGN